MTALNARESAPLAPIKVRKKMGFGWMMAAAVFLFNPDVAGIDVLPDLLGYILLCIGLSQIALLNESLASALNGFKKMLIVSSCKLVALAVMFGVVGNVNANRPYFLLTFTFVFAVLDLIFLVPAWLNFFHGLLYLGGRYGGSAICRKKPTTTENIGEKLLRLTLVFVVVKAVLGTLPEFAALTIGEYTGSFVMYLYEYIRDLRVVACLPALGVGIAWLCCFLRLFFDVFRDEPFLENLGNLFRQNVLPRVGWFTRKSLKNALALMCAGALLCLDLHIENIDILPGSMLDGINIIPDALAAALFLGAAFAMRHYVKNYKKLMIAAGVYLGASLLASFAKVFYLDQFGSFSAVNRIHEAFTLFCFMCGSTVLENIAFLCMVAMLLLALKEMIVSYSGFDPAFSVSSRLNVMQRELLWKLIPVAVFAVAGAVFAVIYDFMLIERGTFAQITWVIDFVLEGCFALSLLFAAHALRDEIDENHRLL